MQKSRTRSPGDSAIFFRYLESYGEPLRPERLPLTSKPNFFIAGAPKCGTTALYEYLSPHPNVFMPKLKEPHFFSKDLSYPIVKTLEDYTRLFSECTEQHLRIGEASASYLCSSVALRNIREFNPDAKIIAMLRNPVDMVYSLHSQLLYWSEETVSDFETAWRLQERRGRGIDVPPTCRDPFWLQYERVGRFGTQIERLLSLFPRSQTKLILYDDFAASPKAAYDEVIEFLGIPSDNRTDFQRVNEYKRMKRAWLKTFIRKPPPGLRNVYRRLKRLVGEERVGAVKQKVVDFNTVKERRAPLSPAFRAELVEVFRDEVALLSRLWDRDLSHWA